LFGFKPGRYLSNAGFRVTVCPGTEKDYNTVTDEFVDYTFTALRVAEDMKKERYKSLEPDFFKLTLDFVGRFVSREGLDSGYIERVRFWDYPPEAIRELIVNACIHRDWTNANTNRIEIYSDRLEITSYGGLPNTLTLEKGSYPATLFLNLSKRSHLTNGGRSYTILREPTTHSTYAKRFHTEASDRKRRTQTRKTVLIR